MSYASRGENHVPEWNGTREAQDPTSQNEQRCASAGQAVLRPGPLTPDRRGNGPRTRCALAPRWAAGTPPVDGGPVPGLVGRPAGLPDGPAPLVQPLLCRPG